MSFPRSCTISIPNFVNRWVVFEFIALRRGGRLYFVIRSDLSYLLIGEFEVAIFTITVDKYMKTDEGCGNLVSVIFSDIILYLGII